MDWFQLIEFIIQGLILGGAGLYVTLQYSKKQQKLAEDKFNHTLLIRFNDWYDKLNNKLHQVQALEKGKENLTLESLQKNNPKLYVALNDYLNLCAEEKLWHSKERIDDRIWASWQAGMEYWYINLSSLQKLWVKETNNENRKSYYLKEDDNLFPFQTSN